MISPMMRVESSMRAITALHGAMSSTAALQQLQRPDLLMGSATMAMGRGGGGGFNGIKIRLKLTVIVHFGELAATPVINLR